MGATNTGIQESWWSVAVRHDADMSGHANGNAMVAGPRGPSSGRRAH